MGRNAVSLHFALPPSALRYYPRAVLARRETLCPEGVAVPRLEGDIAAVQADPGQLQRYRAVCGFMHDGCLPVTYPHALAISLHMALLTHPAFVVRVMGLVHVANEILWRRPLPETASYGMRCWIEGHEETDRGQEFQLFTELVDRDGPAWQERCTLLARRPASGAGAARAARAALRVPKPSPDATVQETGFEVDHGVIRRYGWVSGDINPIHLSDFSARRYGFDRAVAHGMWSMARSLAALGPELTSGPCRIPVEFKLPLFLPAAVRLDQWREDTRQIFILRDANNSRPHLAGAVERS